MKFNTLGRTGITVSEICLGTMTWGGDQNDQADGFEQMDYAVEAGVNFFDTAELYPVTPLSAETQGATESIIGEWMKARANRDKIVVATKISGPGRPYIRGGAAINRKEIEDALAQSLKRLKTDYIDLYQLHWPNRGHYHFRQIWNYHPEKQPPKAEILDNMLECLETLDEAVKAGKIRAVGLSNETAWGTMQFLDLAEKRDLPRMASVQNEYNLLYRAHDLDYAELSHHEKVGLLSYSPLAAGLLSGKYLNGQKPAGSRAAINGDLGGRFQPLQEPAVAAYVDIARRHGLDPSAMALAWCLTKPFMTSVIIGATTMEQLKINLSAADLDLSNDVRQEIAAVIRRYPMPI
ncbi:aryl-alcohol dehydrogenase-like predicted oxidoreductase [Rhizobium sp. SG_E_25_P2]|uniref:aldo/keto reductase n=1 Tax=Rhizobium sp. SG_E_25_P2 TaxID=2879942 RepID=UPI002475B7A7|nr:aldo/keto reductase [Rhizobium sp. SG_E_25_P2]MDH6266810.1 aryl-alcohol dehydrogenase-like predicted oxidoreductase [Rhizobium sp. SG_E_25_P2]